MTVSIEASEEDMTGLGQSRKHFQLYSFLKHNQSDHWGIICTFVPGILECSLVNVRFLSVVATVVAGGRGGREERNDGYF